MRQDSPSLGKDQLRAQRIHYFHTVVEYAAMVSCGADLQALVAGSAYVLLFEQARLVPSLSRTPAVLTVAGVRRLVRRLGDGDSKSVRTLLAHEVARHCLSQDVIRCVSQYHDEAMAQFWLAQIGPSCEVAIDQSKR